MDGDAPQGTDGRSLARDAGASVGARVIAMVASSATAVVIGASLSKHDYGAYALAAGLVGVLAVALDIGTTSALARYVAQGRGAVALVWSIVALRFAALGVGALVLVGIGAAGWGGDGFGDLLVPAAPLLVGLGAVSFMYGALPSLRRIRLLLVVTVVQPLLELAVVVALVARDSPVSHLLLASATAALVAAVLGYLALAARPSRLVPKVAAASDEEPAHVRDVLDYGRKLFLVLLLMMVFGQLDQFVIQFFRGESDVAPYALAIKLQALLVAPAITATAIVAPRIAGAGDAGAAIYRQWLTFFCVLYAGAVAVFAVLAPELFTAINPEYRDDYGVLMALLPFMFLMAIATLPSVTLNQIGYAGSRLRMAATALAVNIVLDLALVPWLGAYGAAIGTSIAFTYYAWAHHHRLDLALNERAGGPPHSARRDLLVGIVAALCMALLAGVLKILVDNNLSGPQDTRAHAVTVLAVAAGIPAVIHTFVTARIIRR